MAILSFNVSAVKYGDVDDDGRVEVVDAVVLMRHLAHFTKYETLPNPEGANVDGVSGISENDGTVLERFLAYWKGYESIPLGKVTKPTVYLEKKVVTEDKLTVSLSVANNPGISSLKLYVKYDEDLTLNDIDFTSLFGAYVTAPTPFKSPQTISMISPLEEIGDSGELATLTFDIPDRVKSGDKLNVKITLDKQNTFDENFDEVLFECVDLNITI